jgi:hypothetical protein
MKERQDRDRAGLRIDAIEDYEWCLGDPRLVDPRRLDVLSGVGVIGKELKEERVDAAKRTLGDVSAEMLMPYSSWLAMSASTRAERTTFMSA